MCEWHGELSQFKSNQYFIGVYLKWKSRDTARLVADASMALQQLNPTLQFVDLATLVCHA
jgi:hypothetical protein